MEEISIQLSSQAQEQKNNLSRLTAADPQMLQEQTRLAKVTADFTNQIAGDIPTTVSNSNHQYSFWFTGTHSPFLVKLALGNLVIVGDEIEYLERVQIQSNANQSAVQSSINAVPSSLTFANQIVTTTSNPQSVTLTNAGTAALASPSPQVTGTNKGDFKIQANSCSSSLAPAASCSLSVTFTPAPAVVGVASGNSTETATLEISGGSGSSPASVPLTGTAVVPSSGVVLSTQPSGTLSFGAQKIGSTTTSVLTITNFQGSALTGLNAPINGANAGDFPAAGVTNTCAASLLTGQNCTITITFALQAGPTGPRTATMTITYTLSGTAQPPPITLSGVAQ